MGVEGEVEGGAEKVGAVKVRATEGEVGGEPSGGGRAQRGGAGPCLHALTPEAGDDGAEGARVGALAVLGEASAWVGGGGGEVVVVGLPANG